MTSISVLQNGASASLNMTPFPHVVIEPALAGQVLSPLWRSFLEHHVSPAFYREATELIVPALKEWHPDRLDFIRRARTVARDMGKGDIDLDSQFVINLPSEKTSRSPFSESDWIEP